MRYNVIVSVDITGSCYVEADSKSEALAKAGALVIDDLNTGEISIDHQTTQAIDAWEEPE